jgi:hypothetical protein
VRLLGEHSSASIQHLMKPFFLLLSLTLAALILARAEDAPSEAPATTAPASPTAIDPAKETEIRKMIRTSGTENTMKVAMNHMFDSFKAQNAALPAKFWTRTESEMDMKSLIDELVPIYAQYYSLADLKAVNAFYESPAGRHMIEVQPQVATAAMQVGQQWGNGVATKIMAEIQAEQAKVAKPPTPAALAPASGK